VQLLIREVELFTFRSSLCNSAFCGGIVWLSTGFPVGNWVYSERFLAPAVDLFWHSVINNVDVSYVPELSTLWHLGRVGGPVTGVFPNSETVLMCRQVSNSETGMKNGSRKDQQWNGNRRQAGSRRRVSTNSETGTSTREAGNVNTILTVIVRKGDLKAPGTGVSPQLE